MDGMATRTRTTRPGGAANVWPGRGVINRQLFAAGTPTGRDVRNAAIGRQRRGSAGDAAVDRALVDLQHASFADQPVGRALVDDPAVLVVIGDERGDAARRRTLRVTDVDGGDSVPELLVALAAAGMRLLVLGGQPLPAGVGVARQQAVVVGDRLRELRTAVPGRGRCAAA